MAINRMYQTVKYRSIKVSIYIKGTLTALLLDLKLRQATNNAASLDTVMQRLWQDFGKRNIGYTEQDYARLVALIAGTSFQDYFDKYINGTAPIEDALDEALQFAGCTLKETKVLCCIKASWNLK